MVYDPSYPTIDMNVFKPNDWKSFYGNVEESIPSNALDPRGKDVDLQLYVDSDHAKVASDLSTHLIALMS
jgi:hypothetical protein